MAKTTCSIDGCDKPVRARGWCTTHHQRWRVHGDPGIVLTTRQEAVCIVAECGVKPKARSLCPKHYERMKKYGDVETFRPDATRGCGIDGCARAHYARGWCRLHADRERKTGNPMQMKPHYSPMKDAFGDRNPSWRGEDVGYFGLHQRLGKDPASNYACVACGNRAEHWAYDHNDPSARVSEEGLEYSVLGSQHYQPMCVSCHRQFDLEYGAAASA
ncbi:hypothetical protein [Curtobacterium flaccumfaciens]|uniref:hypothetical protein n=1 Tax=Curtobacterium flaccumfaciens TaxID=2035 RepID=UPI001BDEE862|nr:hypothetical protein [Curtobacterium flaccumfaciens]MBT1630442.1 hypothetical protein [Curtobacterium flaccumfaciens pv. oortii]MCX2843922.1 hypothetical protein [Curtobacterium flaccumfaciens pv. oortii]